MDARQSRVTVVGTAFNVRNAPDEVIVKVLHGRVRVQPDRDKAGAELTLTAEEGLAVDTHKASYRPVSALESVGGWRNGRLVYRRTPLGEVVQEVAQYVGKPVSLASPPEVPAGFRFRCHERAGHLPGSPARSAARAGQAHRRRRLSIWLADGPGVSQAFFQRGSQSCPEIRFTPARPVSVNSVNQDGAGMGRGSLKGALINGALSTGMRVKALPVLVAGR